MFQVQCEVIAGKPITDIGATITWTIPNESFSRNEPLSPNSTVCVLREQQTSQWYSPNGTSLFQ